MDAKEPQTIKDGDSLPIYDSVYRLVPKDWKEKKQQFLPSVKCFDLSDDDKADKYRLSVEWDKKTTPEQSLIRVGISYKKNNANPPVYKNFRNKEIYALAISFLRELAYILDVIYNPFFNDPEIKGSPNNSAHSLICFDSQNYAESRPFILIELRDHAKNNKINVDMTEVEKKVNEIIDSNN